MRFAKTLQRSIEPFLACLHLGSGLRDSARSPLELPEDHAARLRDVRAKSIALLKLLAETFKAPEIGRLGFLAIGRKIRVGLPTATELKHRFAFRECAAASRTKPTVRAVLQVGTPVSIIKRVCRGILTVVELRDAFRVGAQQAPGHPVSQVAIVARLACTQGDCGKSHFGLEFSHFIPLGALAAGTRRVPRVAPRCQANKADHADH